MGGQCSTSTSGIIDDELLNKINGVVVESVVNITFDYPAERTRIVNKMRELSPKPYEGLNYADYPKKNGDQVNALAARNVTSDEAKDKIADQVKEEIKPLVDEKTSNMNTVQKKLMEKAIDKAVEQAVNKAVDETVKKLLNEKKAENTTDVV